jgi:hypothetical protein
VSPRPERDARRETHDAPTSPCDQSSLPEETPLTCVFKRSSVIIPITRQQSDPSGEFENLTAEKNLSVVMGSITRSPLSQSPLIGSFRDERLDGKALLLVVGEGWIAHDQIEPAAPQQGIGSADLGEKMLQAFLRRAEVGEDCIDRNERGGGRHG